MTTYSFDLANFIAVDFGPAGGGEMTVTQEDIAAYVAKQIESWNTVGKSVSNGEERRLVAAMQQAWRTMRLELATAPDAAFVPAAVHNVVRDLVPMTLEDDTGGLILAIAEEYGPPRALSALSYLRGNGIRPELAQEHARKLENLAAAQLALVSPIRPSAMGALRDRLAKIGDAFELRCNEQYQSLDAKNKTLNDQLQKDLQQVRDAQVARDAEWTAIKSAYSEQWKLRAPAAMWEDRATVHNTQAKDARRALITAVIVGLAIAVIWIWGAHWFAGELFHDATAPEPVPRNAQELAAITAAKAAAAAKFVTTPTLRPTFTAELAFCAAATLLYLTLFVWGVRLLVRNYTTAQHLAIDAKSREVMATTYLGLVEAQAAVADADRAIILAALFRPVTDGMVRDDGPPALTPAAVASGVLAKAGGGQAN